MIDPAFPALSRVVATSTLAHAARWLSAAAAAAWQGSRLRALVRGGASAWHAMASIERARVVALTVFWASLATMGITAFSPQYVRTGLPWPVFGVVATLAMAAAYGAGTVAAAWKESVLVGWLRPSPRR